MTPSPSALITGAGQGLGRACALKLAAHGWYIHLVGRTASKLEAVAAEVRAAGGQAAAHPLDVTEGAALSALAAQLGEAALEAVINSAGEALIKPMEQTTDADWARILAVNLTAPFLVSRAFLPHLRRAANPSLINILSMAALGGHGGVSAYSAAKTGLLGFSRSLAAELAPERIRVIPLCPGPADTPMRWAATPDWDREKLVAAETVADTVWWLVNLPRGTTAGEFLVTSTGLL